MSNVLNINKLRQENNERFNVETGVQLTDEISVIVRTNPSEDIISKVVKNYLDVYQSEETLDLTKASTETIQFFILGSLLKETTNIEAKLNSFEDYTDLVVQLVRAGFFKKIISAYGDDLVRIIDSITEQMNTLTDVLNKQKKELVKTIKPADKKTRNSRSKKKNNTTTAVINQDNTDTQD